MCVSQRAKYIRAKQICTGVALFFFSYSLCLPPTLGKHGSPVVKENLISTDPSAAINQNKPH